MNARSLVDTNILVYAYDFAAPEKQAQALSTLDDLVDSATGVLSTQVLCEFFVVVTRKLASPLSVAEACERIEILTRAWPVVEVSSFVIAEAARGVRDHQLSFWDSLIWASAKLNQIPVVLSEDFSHGQVLDGVRFENPFKQAGS